MATSKTAIFLTGATGYIGGAVLARLLKHPSAETFDITVLTRDANKAKKLETFGVKAVVGTHDDLDKLESLAEQSHVVFSCADADNLPAIQAILQGQRKRHASVGDLPILIHTSGTGEIAEGTKGMYASETSYSDTNVEQIKSIPETAFHRNVDLTVVAADQQGYTKTYIVLPSTIYGIATHPLAQAGISNPHSIQIPNIIRVSIERKQAGMVGLGKSLWPDVHIDDLAELYITIFDTVTRDPELGHGWEGFHFGENGEHSWYDISKAIAVAFVELGLGGSDEPTTFTTEELVKFWGSEAIGLYYGSNVRCTADRGRSIGWKPRKTTKDMIASIKPEVQSLWKEAQEEGGLKLSTS
ncbi:NAD(P)-binding protein [Laetiporus sulphureus 93-53]|uniref:NAD(P)-binding protein n=1 Tax=Laetiporus sulphureus 93-53 TaxID=1314785 RepID=A0A165CR26_9APHY|nr:NAD(P)-binding protein [Laetiporus sulphureus 93-53]KZT03271.1 NAD(P)-binding protein [Laetiporus sulphureus 93-53]